MLLFQRSTSATSSRSVARNWKRSTTRWDDGDGRRGRSSRRGAGRGKRSAGNVGNQSAGARSRRFRWAGCATWCCAIVPSGVDSRTAVGEPCGAARLTRAGNRSSREGRRGSVGHQVRGSTASGLGSLTKRVGALYMMGIVKPGSGGVRVRFSSRATVDRGRFGTTGDRRGWVLVAPCPTMNALLALWPRICHCSR